MADFWRQVLNQAGVRMNIQLTFITAPWSTSKNGEVPFPAPVMRQYRADRGNATESTLVFDPCVYATGMGYTDICIASFAMTYDRIKVSNMIQTFSVDVYLVIPTILSVNTVGEQAAAAFRPYKTQLWLAIIFSVLAMSTLMVLQDLGSKGQFAGMFFREKLSLSAYEGWMSFCGMTLTFRPTSLGARITSMALAAFVLITSAAYTANLAGNFVALQQPDNTIGTIADVIKKNLTVCLSVAVQDLAMAQTRLSANMVRAKSLRTDVLKSIRSGECQVALHRQDDFDYERSSGSYCDFRKVGDPLFAVPQGVPVSERAFRALQFQARTLAQGGGWERMMAGYVTPSACAAPVSAASQSLGFDSMLGPFIAAAVIVCLALVVTLAEAAWLRWRPPEEAVVGPVAVPHRRASYARVLAPADFHIQAMLAPLAAKVAAIESQLAEVEEAESDGDDTLTAPTTADPEAPTVVDEEHPGSWSALSELRARKR